VLDRVEASQARVLNSLLSSARINRLVEQHAVDGAAAYAPLDFLADVRKGVFSELYAGSAVDAYRRNLQRAYIETLSSRVNGAQAQPDDVRAFFRGELRTLDGELQTAARAASQDRATILHYEDLRVQIAKAFDPSAQPATRSTTELTDDFDVSVEKDLCWIDYAVTPRRR
jgi:hypothetical protein